VLTRSSDRPCPHSPYIVTLFYLVSHLRLSPRRLRYAFETRTPPAPRSAAMDAQASKRRGRGSARGTGVGVAPGAQWGLREATSRCWAKGGIHRSRHRPATGRPRFRCCPGTLRGSKLGLSPRRWAALRRRRAARRRRIRCGDRRPGSADASSPDPAAKKKRKMSSITIFVM